MATGVFSKIEQYLAGVRTPRLLMLVAGLFFADLLIPDLIPWVDEILLGIGTLLLSRWRARTPRSAAPKPPPKDVTPRR